MKRNLEYDAIILKITKAGEGHAAIDFLVNDEGNTKLLRAFFYGLAKTKKHYGLRLFQTGKLLVYFTPTAGTYKVVDFQAAAVRAEISESLVRLYCASFACEVSLKLHGNIDFILVNAFLDGVAVSSDEACHTALLRFMWRLLNYSGVAPDCTRCCQCENAFNEALEASFYSKINGAFFCPSCIDTRRPDLIFISAEARRFLVCITEKPASVSRKIILSNHAQQELQNLLFFLITELTGSVLHTLEMIRVW